MRVYITTRSGDEQVYTDVKSAIVWQRGSEAASRSTRDGRTPMFLVLNFASGPPKLVRMSEIIAYRKEVR